MAWNALDGADGTGCMTRQELLTIPRQVVPSGASPGLVIISLPVQNVSRIASRKWRALFLKEEGSDGKPEADLYPGFRVEAV